ncbi:putative retrotransposon ty1-copia subclass protein [Tanacetum coccineum]
MPPKRFKKKSVRKIVEKRVAKAIEKYEKTRADSNNTGGFESINTGGTVVPKMHGCSYKTFMNGKPHSFKGTEGVESTREPPNYRATLSDPESEKWLEAMNTEMQSIKDNQVWILVDLPPNYKTVRSKWLFKKNTDMDGNIHTHKAYLVAKGFTQTYRVDYGETFSPVADIKAIRILIASVL